METIVFIVSAAIILAGAVGVVAFNNPVRSALALVMTLFGVAVLFVAQDAHFLAAVQVIVYAGAIVVLFLFVIMLLGVDRIEDTSDPLPGQRPAAYVAGFAALGLVLIAIFATSTPVTGAVSGTATAVTTEGDANTEALARSLFGEYVLAFELTSVLLVIAVVGTVILARRRTARPDELEAVGQ